MTEYTSSAKTPAAGTPVVFVHEFAGDSRSWEPQVRHFSRRYRCIAFNARGFPPSGVPDDPGAYSQDRARDDVLAVLDGLGIERAHVVGLSMGGFATLHFGLAYPERARSLVVAGVGYGAEPEQRARFRSEADATSGFLRTRGMAAFAEIYAVGPTRVQFRNKDPAGLARVRRDARGAFRGRGRPYAAGSAEGAPFPVRSRRSDAGARRPHPHRDRRRGLALPSFRASS